MAIKSPSLLWKIGQDLGKSDKEQARTNAGIESIKGSFQETKFLTHIAENSDSGNLEAKYAQPKIADVNGLSTELSNLRTYVDYNVSPIYQTDDVTVATGDKLLISDANANGKEVRSGISFSTVAAENLFLNERGAWKSALPTIYNTDASTSVHWNNLGNEGFYSVFHSPSPTTDSTSPEQDDMFALVGNSGTVGGSFRAQLAMGDSLFYRHTTGNNNTSWTDWRTVLTIGSQNIGNAPPYGNYQPVYIKDGEVTACPMLFGELSSEDGDGITLRYDSTNNWYCIGTKSYTAFNNYVETTGTDPNIVPEHFKFEKASSLVFGDGFGVGPNQTDYWGLTLQTHPAGNTRSPLVIEAPSVTYACTSLADYCFEKGQPGDTRLEIEFWNEHRVKDYLVCCQYRNGSASSTSYISSASLNTLDGASGIDLCLIPPHHWGFVNGCITGSSLHRSTYTNMTVNYVDVGTIWASYNYIEVPSAIYEDSQEVWDSLIPTNNITLTSQTESATLTISKIWKPNETEGRPSGTSSDTFIIRFDNATTVPFGSYDMSFVTGEMKYQGNLDFTFALLSTQNNQTYYPLGSNECVGISYSTWTWGGEVSNNSITPCTFSFFCYNPTNENKYVSCCVSNSLSAIYSLHKQLLICKTPEMGGFNWPYVAPPSNMQVPSNNEPNG